MHHKHISSPRAPEWLAFIRLLCLVAWRCGRYQTEAWRAPWLRPLWPSKDTVKEWESWLGTQLPSTSSWLQVTPFITSWCPVIAFKRLLRLSVTAEIYLVGITHCREHELKCTIMQKAVVYNVFYIHGKLKEGCVLADHIKGVSLLHTTRCHSTSIDAHF